MYLNEDQLTDDSKSSGAFRPAGRAESQAVVQAFISQCTLFNDEFNVTVGVNISGIFTSINNLNHILLPVGREKSELNTMIYRSLYTFTCKKLWESQQVTSYTELFSEYLSSISGSKLRL